MAWGIGMYQAWMYERQVEPSVTSSRSREGAPVAPAGKAEAKQTALTAILETYGTSGARVTSVKTGAAINRHYVELPIGADTAKIEGKLVDIARGMKSPAIMLDRNAGNGLVAFDIPRKDRQSIMLDSVLDSPEWAKACSDMILPVVIGEFIDGEKFILDLPKAIHAIIAGTSGCGKSSLVNAILLSLMQSRTPDQVKLLLIDPKVVEFTDYSRSTYLYHPVVTDMDKALEALNELVLEMEIRYQMMAAAGVKNIIGYQRLNGAKDKAVKSRLESLDASKFGSDVASHGLDMPYIVCVVDEFADLMAVSSDDVETAVARLGQKARAAGIIDLLLTQRPSVDVITGLIKANCPTRFGLTTVSGIDSKTIIDTVGLEKLLSMGDMLYISPSDGKPKRAHSAYVPDEMIKKFMK
jgi:S-DNA-T family DNA segregation ATPase FtsK/SpoIIIE